MNINSTLFLQAVVFAILVWFTMKFVWPPITKALDERAQKISDGLAAADKAKSELSTANKRVEAELATSRTETATRLADAASGALTADTVADRWATVLDALSFSPVRLTVSPASKPETPNEELVAVVTRIAGRVPKVAEAFGIEAPAEAPRKRGRPGGRGPKPGGSKGGGPKGGGSKPGGGRPPRPPKPPIGDGAATEAKADVEAPSSDVGKPADAADTAPAATEQASTSPEQTGAAEAPVTTEPAAAAPSTDDATTPPVAGDDSVVAEASKVEAAPVSPTEAPEPTEAPVAPEAPATES